MTIVFCLTLVSRNSMAQTIVSPYELAKAITTSIYENYQQLEIAKANLALIKATMVVYKKTKNKVEKEYILSRSQNYLSLIEKKTPSLFKPYIEDLKNRVNKLRYYNKFNQPQNAYNAITRLSKDIDDLYFYLSWV